MEYVEEWMFVLWVIIVLFVMFFAGVIGALVIALNGRKYGLPFWRAFIIGASGAIIAPLHAWFSETDFVKALGISNRFVQIAYFAGLIIELFWFCRVKSAYQRRQFMEYNRSMGYEPYLGRGQQEKYPPEMLDPDYSEEYDYTDVYCEEDERYYRESGVSSNPWEQRDYSQDQALNNTRARFCSNCGYKRNNAQEYCPVCGKKFEA